MRPRRSIALSRLRPWQHEPRTECGGVDAESPQPQNGADAQHSGDRVGTGDRVGKIDPQQAVAGEPPQPIGRRRLAERRVESRPE
jgi:hypothetical protein